MTDNGKGRKPALAAEMQIAETGRQPQVLGPAEFTHSPQEILQEMPVMLKALDNRHNIVFWNKECTRITGYRSDEIVGNPRSMELLYPKATPWRQVIRQWTKRSDDGHKVELQITCKDGRMRDILWSSTPNVCGVPEWGLCVTGVDITEVKRPQSDESRRQHILEGLFNATTESVVLVRADGTICAANQITAQRLGIERETLIGLNIEDIPLETVPPDVMRGRIEAIRHVIDSGKAVRFEDIRRGEIVDSSMVPVFDDDGRVTHVAIFGSDVTEQRRLELKMAEHRDKLASAEKQASMGAMSAALAHEITQPLSVVQLSVQNATEALEAHSNDRDLRSSLHRALQGMSQATGLVDRFRRFTRRSCTREATQVCLADVAEIVARLVRTESDRPLLDVQLKGLESLPDVYCDRGEAEQVFFALIQNAAQAATGKRKHRLQISGIARKDHVELQFSDDCGGISPEHLDRIFEPFFSTKPADGGAGLGLAVARNIVSRSGGSIRVKNRYGIGSAFFVTWPVKQEETWA